MKVADVIAVNGNYLMTTGETTGVVKNNNVRTFINSNDYSNDSTMAPSDKYLKKGQKLTFDQAVTFVSQLDDFDHDPYDYYRINGRSTKSFTLGYNLVKIEHRGYVLPNIYNSKNNWQYITDRPVWNFGKDSHFWLGYAASDVKNKQPLDIKEIAEESTKKPALKKLVKQYYGLKGNRFFIYNRQGKLIKKLTLKKEKIFKVKGHRIVKNNIKKVLTLMIICLK
ncbi:MULTISPECIES: hypothetical protein [unclassified Lactobacillus]|uniref:hypothetical protein n=1 Tax=unclassified Lactobacillus TaxID=2620435 RepID=UPI001E6103CB|nr:MULTISPECIES: hypothetical protein [unclassified Lactobacillus]